MDIYGAKREQILNKAKSIVTGERYGSPENNFQEIANLWSTYLNKKLSEEIKPQDVAVMMILLKIARITSGHGGEDNWIDIVGYASIGGELEGKE